MEPWAAAKKSFKLVWRCHQVLSGFLAKSHLPRVSCQSRRSLMIRVAMKWSWRLCTDLLAFALQLRKTSTRRPSDERAVQPVIASNGVPFLQMRSHSTSGRKLGEDGNLVGRVDQPESNSSSSPLKTYAIRWGYFVTSWLFWYFESLAAKKRGQKS